MTTPPEIANWSLSAGRDNQFGDPEALQTASNLDCTVTVSTDGISGGFLTPSQGGENLTPMRQLANPLRVDANGGPP